MLIGTELLLKNSLSAVGCEETLSEVIAVKSKTNSQPYISK